MHTHTHTHRHRPHPTLLPFSMSLQLLRFLGIHQSRGLEDILSGGWFLGRLSEGREARGLSWWWFGSGSGRSSGASTHELSLSRLAASLCSLRSSAVALRVWSFFLLVLLAGSLVGHLVRVSNSITTTTTISREKGRYISWFRQNGTESVERGTPRVQCSIVSAHGCGSM